LTRRRRIYKIPALFEAASPTGTLEIRPRPHKFLIFQWLVRDAGRKLEHTTMYAVFRSGGKQYRASKGDRLKLEKIEAEEGAKVSFDEVLLVGEGGDVEVGTPYLSGGSVSATVLKQGKSRKVNVVKFRRRQNYLRQHTHRQFFTEVEVTGISGGKAGSKPAAPSEDKGSDDKPAAKKAAAKKPAKKKAAKKAASKKASSKKTATKKPAAKKKAAKKTAARKDD
jgi:large subunit ribosomal protein L21